MNRPCGFARHRYTRSEQVSEVNFWWETVR
jgi:hypothetical protein